MSKTTISDCVKYVGVNDKMLDLFESQYVIPNGVSYNSYVIIDDKIAIMDTVDKRAKEEWLDNIEKSLDGRNPDYLVVSHMEPDHSAVICELVEKYPNITVVGNAKTFGMMNQFFDGMIFDNTITVKDGETLSLGQHTLHFVFAPMVHWPEVMVEYEEKEKILFSADGFGKFGTLDTDEEWTDEARRYYINIIGKYGTPVQTLLKKASTLDIKTICPLHGPILKETLGLYLDKYNIWSSYQPEEKGVVVAYASIHGNTEKAAKKMVELLITEGVEKVSLFDLSRDDFSHAVSDAFRYDRMILMGASYDGGVFPCMESFLNRLAHKSYQNRAVAYIENGSWAPCAAKSMKAIVSTMKNITEIEPNVTIKSAMNDESLTKMSELAKAVADF